MIAELIQLVILFVVIFDPPASLAVLLAAARNLNDKEKSRIGILAVTVAAAISFVVLIFGEAILGLFSTTIADFRVAGGIVLTILGVMMALGHPLANLDTMKANSSRAIAALIGTPLLTGPAAITAIIVSIHDYGRLLTGLSLAIVLGGCLLLFARVGRVDKYLGRTGIQVLTTIFGLITLSWGVKFIRLGLGI